MRKGGGKAKGSSFEREICVKLSQWVTEGKQDDVFWRSAMSGGRATVAHKKGKLLSSQVGDISCVHPSGANFIKAFAAECKFYASLDYEGLLTGKGKLLTFWNEIRKQAKTHNKQPILFARQNRMQTMVCLGIDGRRLLDLSYREMLLVSQRHSIHIIEAERFFKVCKPFQ